jgi:quinoprotein glucose dehydrogenase
MPPSVSIKALVVVLCLFGLALLGAGSLLLRLGGSPYYIFTGAALILDAVLFWRSDRRALWVFAAVLVGTAAWSIWECGFDAWPLLPRIGWVFALGFWIISPPVRSTLGNDHVRAGLLPASLVTIALVLAIGIALHSPHGQAASSPSVLPGALDTGGKDDWKEYGRDPGGTRFSPLTEITAANVQSLTRVWSYRTGVMGPDALTFEATPLKIGDRLYLCSSGSVVIALDADDGHEIWRFAPKVDLTGVYVNTCRGVAYFKATNDATPCAERLFTTTPDLRLIALDLETGTPCRDFGENGIVKLGVGLGSVDPGVHQVTSAPQVVLGRVIVGGKINDNRNVDMPSGVIRAFDAITGALAWAWDMGSPGVAMSGGIYTRSTPNSWAPMSVDEQLGLVFLPTGNASPDYFGGYRRPFDDLYSSSVVALEAVSGRVRWSFQTAHHDLWDYDVPAQPTLVDLKNGEKAVLVGTKRGELFMLDRRNGQPLARVEERGVPQHGVPEERLALRQPFSVGMPSFAGVAPTEARMWGLTIFDQLWCRIKFRQARFEGTMTPLETQRFSVIWPGFMGGFEWGGVAVDVDRDVMIVNTNNVSNYDRLIPRDEYAKIDVHHARSRTPAARYSPQTGTPYAVDVEPFLSPLDVPCTQPPFGTLAAVDLTTRRVIWSKPFGTTAGSGPLGLRSHLPLPMGVPNLGGAVATRGGIFFIGASQDSFFRAYETTTGRELWRVALPAGGQATPMTYWSSKGNRQLVVIAAGGHAGIRANKGDYLVAFALPPSAKAR